MLYHLNLYNTIWNCNVCWHGKQYHVVCHLVLRTCKMACAYHLSVSTSLPSYATGWLTIPSILVWHIWYLITSVFCEYNTIFAWDVIEYHLYFCARRLHTRLYGISGHEDGHRCTQSDLKGYARSPAGQSWAYKKFGLTTTNFLIGCAPSKSDPGFVISDPKNPFSRPETSGAFLHQKLWTHLFETLFWTSSSTPPISP